MVDMAASFLVELLGFVPEDSVFSYDGVEDEALIQDLQEAGYSAEEIHAWELPIGDKLRLMHLIQHKRLHWRISHCFIIHGQENLLTAYDHMMHTWVPQKLNFSQSFIKRYSLVAKGEDWVVGEFPELDD